MNFLKFNDSWHIIWMLVMFITIISPELFFASNASRFSMVAITYVVATLLLKPKMKQTDISQNWLKYIMYFGTLLLIFSFATNKAMYDVNFTSIFTKLLFVVFVIGYSESLIRRGVHERTGNPIIAVVVMGIAHTGAYMSLLGEYNFMAVLPHLFTAMVGFTIFQLVYYYTKDTMIEAMVHGFYNLQFY